MSAYGLTEEEIAALTEAMTERLNSLPLHPHQRLGYPPMLKGKDVTAQRLTTEQTVEHLKRRNVQ